MHAFLTVEAALVLPVFIFAILAFIYLLQVLQLQEVLQNAITETGLYAAKYAYVYDYLSEDETSLSENEEKLETADALIAHSIDSTFYKLKLRDYLDATKVNNTLIKDGYEGIHTYLSSFMEDDSAVDIILIYKIKLPLAFFKVNDIQIVQRVKMRGWSGYSVSRKKDNQDQKEEEVHVYITQTGTVYHLNKECTHLKLSIRSTPFSQIESLRNLNGGKYKKCDLCTIDFSGNEEVYITNSGDHYHINLNCSGLKRTILTVPLSEVGDRRICTRCGNGRK